MPSIEISEPILEVKMIAGCRVSEAIKETIAICQLIECLAELNVFAGIKINISPASNYAECMAQYESQFPTP